MAKASIEFGRLGLRGVAGSNINGECLAQEELAVSGSAANSTISNTVAIQGDGATVCRIASDDTAFYAAVGSTPDATALVMTEKTSARRLVAAGGSIELPAKVGDKVQVKGLA